MLRLLPGFLIIGMLGAADVSAQEPAAATPAVPQASKHAPKGHFRFSAGLGAQTGILGIGMEASPVEYFSLCIAASPIVPGVAGGLKIFPIGRSQLLRPRLSAFTGTAVFPTIWGAAEESYAAYGGGLEWGINSRNSIDFGVDILTGGVRGIVPTVAYGYHF